MGRKKQLKYINGALAGDYLNKETCDKLEAIINLAKLKGEGSVPQIKKSICNLSDNDVETIKALGSSEGFEKPEGTLDDAQTLSVSFMFFSKRCLVGDSVGLGKTVEFAATSNLIKRAYGFDKKFLFLTEKTYIEEIRSKLIKFTGEFVDVCMGEKKQILQYADRVDEQGKMDTVGTHSLLTSPVFYEFCVEYKEKHGKFPFDVLVVDESFILQNTATQTYKKALKLTEGVDFIYLLNATPFSVKLSELYAQINFTDSTFLPTKTDFSQAFEIMDYSGFFSKPSGKYKNEELFREQVRYRYFAQTRKSIGAVMKDCEAKIVTTPLSYHQKNLLRMTQMPQMVYDYPSYFSSFTNIEEVSPKVEVLTKLIQNDFKDEKSILVYTQYKEVQDEIQLMLELEGISAEVLNGETSQDLREAITKGFRENKFRVLITTVQRGMDFGNCNVCIFYSMGFSPAHMRQFEGRMTRSKDVIGKKSYIICTEGQELNKLNTILKSRAEASELFTESDFSVVLQLLIKDKEGDNEK